MEVVSTVEERDSNAGVEVVFVGRVRKLGDGELSLRGEFFGPLTGEPDSGKA